MSVDTEKIVPRAFVWRRLHSLMGLWLVIYIIEHLVTNSQAALWLGDNGIGFIKLVNFYHSLPYLQVIEIVLLGVPIGVHGVLGIKYALTAKTNSFKTDGSKPSMRHGRNRAFTWQRLTSWILLFGIIFHVIQMRFLDMPKKVMFQNQEYYLARLSMDEGLYTLSKRLDVDLYDQEEINNYRRRMPSQATLESDSKGFFDSANPVLYNSKTAEEKEKMQSAQEAKNWINALGSFSLKPTQIVSVSKSVGTSILLATRDTFKNPWYSILYSIFVLAAGYHAFNGLWTFLITWGALLSMRSQKSMVGVCMTCVIIVVFLGFAAIWGSYWINLRN